MPDDFTRLFWVTLPLGLCAEGRGMDNVSWIKAKVFPLRLDVTAEKISNAMDWFAARGMINRYEVGGRNFFYIPTWHDYQGDTKREATSIYPAPPQDKQPEQSGQDRDFIPTNSSTDAHGDAHGEGDAGSPPQPPQEPELPDGVSSALRIYEEKTGTLVPNGLAAELIMDTVENDERHLDMWSKVVSGWVLSGFKTNNVSGMIDCYRQGRIPSTSGGNGRHPQQEGTGPPPKPQPAVVNAPTGDPEWMHT